MNPESIVGLQADIQNPPVVTPDNSRMSKPAMFGALLVSLPAAVFMIGVPFAKIYEEKPEEFTDGAIAFGGSVAVFAVASAVIRSVVRRQSQS